METLQQDLRYGVRRLIKSPGFSALIVLTLALGIGANTAIFSVVNTILLRPLPYREADRLVTINHFYPGLNNLEAPVSAPGFRAYRDRTHSFESVAVENGFNANFTGSGEPQRLIGSKVSGDYFKVYGVSAAHGRTLLREEDEPGRNQVVVLSDALWRRLYGGQPSAIGKTMVLNGEPYTIVGVMPPSFKMFYNERAELWTPLALKEDRFDPGRWGNEFLPLSARLKPGVTVTAAVAEMHQFADQLKRDRPNYFGKSWTLSVKPLRDVKTGNIKPALLVLLGAVTFVLLIACANVANLLLARAAGRMKEIGVRTALGASRWRLVRQLLTESVILSLAGGVLGLLLAYWGVRILARINPSNVPFVTNVTIDGRVMLFTLGISLLTGLVFGLVPALQSIRSNLQETLRGEGRGSTGDRTGHAVRRTLVVAEMALALMLLAGAGLLIKSFGKLQGVDPGFNSSHLLTFNVSLPAAKYKSDTAQIAFYREALERVSALPQVRAAAISSTMPFSGNWSTSSFDIEGVQRIPNQPGPWGDFRIVSPDFLKTMQVKLIKGRFLTEQDRKGSQDVVVVDEELVKRYLANVDPIGKRITFDGLPTPENPNPQWITIVGVVAHTMHEGLDANPRIQVYFPYQQMDGLNGMTFALRTSGDPLAAVALARQAIRSVDRDQPISDVKTMDDMVDQSLGQRKLSMFLLSLFAGLATLLASLGIYGLMAHLVQQRQREIGVRMALGAATRDVLTLVLRQGMTLAGAGVLIGAGGAVVLTRLISSQLYSVKATDPVTFVAVALLLGTVAFVATSVPAVRAARLDPVSALRRE